MSELEYDWDRAEWEFHQPGGVEPPRRVPFDQDVYPDHGSFAEGCAVGIGMLLGLVATCWLIYRSGRWETWAMGGVGLFLGALGKWGDRRSRR